MTEITLAECPVGLFVTQGGTLCLKTEYIDNDGVISAYIVATGEMFWGSHPQTIGNQRAQLVRPVAMPLIHPDASPDTQRLDWLSTVTANSWLEIGHDEDTGEHWICQPEYADPAAAPHGLRAAIDAAMMRERTE
jgi:phytoene dehydrogenase-like protein